MCSTCGCDQPGGITITKVRDEVEHFKPLLPGALLAANPMHHDHDHSGTNGKTIVEVEQDILSKNNLQAKHNRNHFGDQGIFSINLVSSPGSGKTSLLERTLTDLKGQSTFFVIEGDQQTLQDANRIAATGSSVVQINTGKGCHLDADMVHRALHQLNPTDQSVVFIENVGNLVCPALFDLGESARVVIISVTEGDDKPLKYPDMFASANLCIINKIDLLPYVNFDVSKAIDYARRANSKMKIIELSATTGQGMKQWYDWIEYSKSKIVSLQM
jgi:hydrogenase nickel incorporation protein HypB